MENLHLVILKDVGGICAGAEVTIYDTGTTDVSTIYSDDGVTPESNPLTSDAYGRTNFYALNGSYDITVSGDVTLGISEYTMSDVKLFDGSYEKHTVTGAEVTSREITISAYEVGGDSLKVYLNGMLQCITDDYAETDATTITFVADILTEDDILILRG